VDQLKYSDAELLRRFPQTRLLVVGDVMLDRYIYGEVTRISPEAPVPVVRKTREVAAPGGAANTAANVAALGARVTLAGVVGADEAGAALRRSLEQRGVDAGALVADAARATSVKTRIVAHQQQVVRLDEETSVELALGTRAELLMRCNAALSGSQAVVLSDYAKGALGAGAVAQLVAAARAAGVAVLADPKTHAVEPWRGVTLLKPNRLELGQLAGRPVHTHEETLAAGAEVLAQLEGGALLVTEGAEGMTLFQPHQAPRQFQSVTRTVFDVTGAGDTVLAALAVALAAGATLEQAAHLAQVAASLVVQKLGTEVIRLDELARAIQ
jgi:D-beta-D-heptose 7-phosphate kinase/D-beta-D-heptose 1-phosphate adenosyltransferase